MIVQTGAFLLILAFCLTILSLTLIPVGVKRRDHRFIESAYRAIIVVFFSVTGAALLLIYLFLADDFSIEYVASYSERALPLFYKITGLWAGQKGSLLFWEWLLSLFTTTVILLDRNRPNNRHLPIVTFTMGITNLFFLFLLVFITPPFEQNNIIPPDGNGLNPLLQNPGMVFHPPALYLGYVGFTVPFSYAMAALFNREVGEWWISRSRGWTLFSWAFLTLGIVFGGWWAYRELGWGGVWGWDPVENASLMPWLTSTAFLHSVIIQERRGMMKIWNIVLIITTFSLCILGTFITRSGIITSVHAFGQSSVGFVFLGFLLVILLISGYFITSRYNKLKERNPRIESLVSRESAFLYNNIVLFGLTFATLWGTLFPLIVEAVKGVKISVGPPYFNRVNTPIFLALLILMAVCPLLAWRRTSLRGLRKNLLLPGVLTLPFIIILYFITNVKDALPLSFYAFCLFVVFAIILEVYAGVRARMRRGLNWFSSLWSLLSINRRRYGGYMVHLGVVFVVVGLVSYGFFQYKDNYRVKPGDSITIGDYRLQYIGLQQSQGRNFISIGAIVNVYQKDRYIDTLIPEKRFYKRQEPTTEVAIRTTPVEDLYLILSNWQQDGTVNLTVVINPLIAWSWYGTGLIVLGVLWSGWPRKRTEMYIEALERELLGMVSIRNSGKLGRIGT